MSWATQTARLHQQEALVILDRQISKKGELTGDILRDARTQAMELKQQMARQQSAQAQGGWQSPPQQRHSSRHHAPQPAPAAAQQLGPRLSEAAQRSLSAKLREFGVAGAEGIAQRIMSDRYVKMKRKGRLAAKDNERIRASVLIIDACAQHLKPL